MEGGRGGAKDMFAGPLPKLLGDLAQPPFPVATPMLILKMVSLIYFIVSEINILIKFR